MHYILSLLKPYYIISLCEDQTDMKLLFRENDSHGHIHRAEKNILKIQPNISFCFTQKIES